MLKVSMEMYCNQCKCRYWSLIKICFWGPHWREIHIGCDSGLSTSSNKPLPLSTVEQYPISIMSKINCNSTFYQNLGLVNKIEYIKDTHYLLFMNAMCRCPADFTSKGSAKWKALQCLDATMYYTYVIQWANLHHNHSALPVVSAEV